MDITAHEWHIIANPTLLNGHRAEIEQTILKQLEENNIRYTLHVADGGERSGETAERLCREGQRFLMMMGGDGSINEIVNGIYRSGVDTEEVNLAIIPLGTGNDFCRTLGCPKAEGSRACGCSLCACRVRREGAPCRLRIRSACQTSTK